MQDTDKLKAGKTFNNNYPSSNLKIDTTDIEAKKVLEREMNPYLQFMKNELNMQVENFKKDIQDKSEIINNAQNLNTEIENLKSSNEVIQNSLQERILKIFDILNNHDKKIKEIQNELNKKNKLNPNIPSQNDDISFAVKEISRINEKISNMDVTNENILKEIKSDIE